MQWKNQTDVKAGHDARHASLEHKQESNEDEVQVKQKAILQTTHCSQERQGFRMFWVSILHELTAETNGYHVEGSNSCNDCGL